MNRIKKIDNIIVILSFILLTYQTCTFFQAYYSFYATFAMFLLIVILDLISCHFRYPIGRERGLVYLTLVIIVLTCVAPIRRISPIAIFGGYFPIVMWTLLFFIVNGCISRKQRRCFIALYVIPWFVSVAATLRVVLEDHEAARLLAGVATDAERAAYYSQGVGGYGFVYGCVFFMFCILLWRTTLTKTRYSAIVLIVVIMGYVMVLFSSYAFAVILSVVTLILYVYVKSRSKYALFGLIAAVIVVLLFRDQIFGLFVNIGRSLKLSFIEKRFTQLLQSDQTDGYESLRRYNLYKRSIISFLVSPMIGRDKIGKHSTMLDLMGRFGMIGVMVNIGIIGAVRKIQRQFPIKYGIIFIFALVLFIINTLDSLIMLPILMFMCPLILRDVQDFEKNVEKRVELK